MIFFKDSIKRLLYVMFIAIVVINLVIIVYQYFEINKYYYKVSEKKRESDFLIIKNMINSSFDYISNKSSLYSQELENRLNTVYKLQNEGYFRDIQQDLDSAKGIVSSNIKIGEYDIFLMNKEGQIITSTANWGFLNELYRTQYMNVIIDMSANNDGKMYISPPLFSLKKHNMYKFAITLSADGEFLIGMSFKMPLPKEIQDRIGALKDEFNNLIALDVCIVIPEDRTIIDLQNRSLISGFKYEEMLKPFKDFKQGHAQNDVDMFNSFSRKNFHLLREEERNGVHTDTFFSIRGNILADFENYYLFVRAELIENSTRELSYLQNIVLFFSLLSVVLIWFFYSIMRHKVLKPLSIINEAILKNSEIDNKELLEQKNEIAAMAKSLNLMRKKIALHLRFRDRLYETQRRFVSNSIHELSTPLSVIHINADLLEMMHKNVEEVRYIRGAINQIVAIKEDISYMILNDKIDYKIDRVDLCKGLEARVEFFTPVAWANDKRLNFICAESVVLDINKTEFNLLIDNNISNAIKYGVHRQDIDIIISKEESYYTLAFVSEGLEIKNPDLIFDRFYKEKNDNNQSFGIGLSIVKRVCNKYGYSYDVKTDGYLNSFIYKIPIKESTWKLCY